MARIVKEEEYAARRNEILDATQQLVYTKGYEQMSIQDILDALQISKGAFYHYFASKGEVLDSLIERMVVEEVVPLLLHIVENPQLSAIEKMHAYFDTSLQWKSGRKAFVMELLRVWLSDENAIVRQKLTNTAIENVTPLLAEIIRQGKREDVFTTSYPEQTCQVIIYTLLGLSGSIIELLISDESERNATQVKQTVAEYSHALNDVVERLLGASRGSMHLIDPETLEGWFPVQETVQDTASVLSVENRHSSMEQKHPKL
jgi:TetR/AcrR family transcriptional repressor of nem operon